MESPGATLEVLPEAHDECNLRLQAEMDQMLWAHESTKSSWYMNDSGRIYILSPWRLVDYWSWTRRPDPDEFVIS